MTQSNPPTTSPPPRAPPRSVHSTTLVDLLQQSGSSLLISTYQAGKLIIARADAGTLNTHFRNFDTPMGLAPGSRTPGHRD